MVNFSFGRYILVDVRSTTIQVDWIVSESKEDAGIHKFQVQRFLCLSPQALRFMLNSLVGKQSGVEALTRHENPNRT